MTQQHNLISFTQGELIQNLNNYISFEDNHNQEKPFDSINLGQRLKINSKGMCRGISLLYLLCANQAYKKPNTPSTAREPLDLKWFETATNLFKIWGTLTNDSEKLAFFNQKSAYNITNKKLLDYFAKLIYSYQNPDKLNPNYNAVNISQYGGELTTYPKPTKEQVQASTFEQTLLSEVLKKLPQTQNKAIIVHICGHAMALYKTDRKYIFFDPNHGEHKFTSADSLAQHMISYLPNLVRQYTDANKLGITFRVYGFPTLYNKQKLIKALQQELLITSNIIVSGYNGEKYRICENPNNKGIYDIYSIERASSPLGLSKEKKYLSNCSINDFVEKLLPIDSDEIFHINKAENHNTIDFTENQNTGDLTKLFDFVFGRQEMYAQDFLQNLLKNAMSHKRTFEFAIECIKKFKNRKHEYTDILNNIDTNLKNVLAIYILSSYGKNNDILKELFAHGANFYATPNINLIDNTISNDAKIDVFNNWVLNNYIPAAYQLLEKINTKKGKNEDGFKTIKDFFVKSIETNNFDISLKFLNNIKHHIINNDIEFFISQINKNCKDKLIEYVLINKKDDNTINALINSKIIDFNEINDTDKFTLVSTYIDANNLIYAKKILDQINFVNINIFNTNELLANFFDKAVSNSQFDLAIDLIKGDYNNTYNFLDSANKNHKNNFFVYLLDSNKQNIIDMLAEDNDLKIIAIERKDEQAKQEALRQQQEQVRQEQARQEALRQQQEQVRQEQARQEALRQQQEQECIRQQAALLRQQELKRRGEQALYGKTLIYNELRKWIKNDVLKMLNKEVVKVKADFKYWVFDDRERILGLVINKAQNELNFLEDMGDFNGINGNWAENFANNIITPLLDAKNNHKLDRPERARFIAKMLSKIFNALIGLTIFMPFVKEYYTGSRWFNIDSSLGHTVEVAADIERNKAAKVLELQNIHRETIAQPA